MAIKDLIARGIGFSPGSIKFIPTLGFASADLWTVVSQGCFIVNANAGGGSVTLTLPGSPASGDLVLVSTASDGAAGAPVSSGQGYESLASATSTVGSHVEYKAITSDTTVDIDQPLSRKAAVGIQIWRGQDATPIDMLAQTASAGTGDPDPPSATTVTADTLRVVVGMQDDDDQAASVGAPAGYTNLLACDTGQASSTVGATVMIASKIATSIGAEDPGAFTSSGDDAWFAVHFGLRVDQGLAASLRQRGGYYVNVGRMMVR